VAFAYASSCRIVGYEEKVLSMSDSAVKRITPP